jgi:hypothetical protein
MRVRHSQGAIREQEEKVAIYKPTSTFSFIRYAVGGGMFARHRRNILPSIVYMGSSVWLSPVLVSQSGTRLRK